MEILELVAVITGISTGVILPYIGAMQKHNGNFSPVTYYHQNKWRICAGVVASIAAVGVVITLTPQVETEGILFRGVLFFAASAPIPYLQLIMKKTNPKEK